MTIIPPDVIDGVLVSAISALGRILVGSVSGLRPRRADADLDIARWLDTYQLAGDGPPLVQDLPPEAAEQIETGLRRGEIQAVLQELLAARLTDAPETDIARIRTTWDLSFAQDRSLALAAEYSGTIFDYYDDKIGDLVVRLEAAAPAALVQIREGAFSTRLSAVLHAIERHTAALTTRRNERTEASFLASYRRHVIDQHGKLDPPDFQRRRRVRISDIYVPTGITEESPRDELSTKPGNLTADKQYTEEPVDPPALSVFDLAGRLDRTVLLGDPGGGKTTAATVLMHRFASDETGQVPFLVTLREYAATDPPERSVIGYIEHTLATFYQCPAPVGLVDLLLLTRRAVVIFDGLDELLDTSRRVDVTTRVERFCAEYPQAPVLVTSRAVGYDQARLDDRQFSRYRLGGFTQDQVSDYVRKWFAHEDGVKAGESMRSADSFMSESSSVPDLRTNPLMLALMCILYRGEGSLPRSRAEVYEQCSSLLIRKWDARRRIHVELRAAHHLEPALRYLAWWLFTRDEMQPAVTERELVNETTAFLHGRGFESEAEAREAAAEFVQFCRGRLWVLSDAGTTGTGEVLYSFTHRTFLEYFSAAHLAYRCDTPERLATVLATHVARQEWEVVSELAVQIKDRTSDKGADRVYAALLRDRRYRSSKSRSGILQYLARSLLSVDPSPSIVRELTRAVLTHLFAGSANDHVRYSPLSWLITSGTSCYEVISDEIDKRIATMVSSASSASNLDGLRLAVWAPYASWGTNFRVPDAQEAWRVWGKERAQVYSSAVISAAEINTEMRYAALMWNLISTDQALKMPGGILPLVQVQPTGIFEIYWASHLVSAVVGLAQGSSYVTRPEDLPGGLDKFAAVGRFLIENPKLPWVPGPAQSWWAYHSWNDGAEEGGPVINLDPVTYLGAAAILLIATEDTEIKSLPQGGPDRFGPLRDVSYYILRRWGQWKGKMPDLPVPPPFSDLFLKWANNEIDFTRPAGARG